MRQRILGSHTPPCHKRMVITTLSLQGGGGGTKPLTVTVLSQMHTERVVSLTSQIWSNCSANCKCRRTITEFVKA